MNIETIDDILHEMCDGYTIGATPARLNNLANRIAKARAAELEMFRELADRWERLVKIDSLQVTHVQPQFLVARTRGYINELLALLDLIDRANEEAK